MLGKLMKYEFKACGRTFIPLYIGILVLSVINGLCNNYNVFQLEGNGFSFSMGNVQGILVLVLFALFVALFVITIILTIQRFKKNLLDDEGYLMFTLPVKSINLILSKYLVSMIFAILSGIVAVVSFIFIGTFSGNVTFNEIIEIFTGLNLSGYDLEVILYMIALMFISYSMFILTMYLALSIGQLPLLAKHKVPAGFIVFFGINFVISYIQNAVVSLVGGNSYNLSNEITLTFSGYSGFIMIFNILMVVGVFFLINWILNKQLNLE